MESTCHPNNLSVFNTSNVFYSSGGYLPMPIPAPSDARLHVAAPSASNVPTLTHDWSFDHGLPSHGASPELLSWLTLFKD
jgi:hypothetical protein